VSDIPSFALFYSLFLSLVPQAEHLALRAGNALGFNGHDFWSDLLWYDLFIEFMYIIVASNTAI